MSGRGGTEVIGILLLLLLLLAVVGVGGGGISATAAAAAAKAVAVSAGVRSHSGDREGRRSLHSDNSATIIKL